MIHSGPISRTLSMHTIRETAMRALLAAIVLVCLSLFPAQADDAAEIRAVIEDQIEAFRTDDGARAFGHASPGIQARFGTPDTFMTMVETSYPQVYRPRIVEFQKLEQGNGLTVQEVFFFGQKGSAVIGRYCMQRNTEGVWKICGVDLKHAPQLGA